MRFLIIYLTMLCMAFSAPVKKKTVSAPVKPVAAEVTTPQLAPGSVLRTAEQEALLKDWVQGIQKEAKDAQTDADSAEKEAAASREELTKATTSLTAALTNADTLQKSIDLQAQQLQEAIKDKLAAQAHDAKTTKENNMLKTIIGIEAALVAIFLCLLFKVPSLSPPYGLIATILAPVLTFAAIKLLL